MLTRRRILNLGLTAACVGWLRPGVARAQAPDEALNEGLVESDLIYLTPLRSDGSESRCQAEIWFAYDGADLFVVTATDAWRAEAVRQGLSGARIWVGDLGNWKSTEGRYRELPALEARASFVADDETQTRILGIFGDKYPLSWLRWGPKFRNGLADGSRVMLRYARTSA
jgi:hypothetical protein